MAAEAAEPGLAVQFRQGERTDRLVLPYPALHVEPTEAPSAFLEAGPFAAEFCGWISVELRAQYTFTAESSAEIELLINGREVLAGHSPGPALSKPVRLNKGTNSFLLRLAPVTNRATFVRLLWSGRNNPVPVPIPAAAFTYTPDAALQTSLAAHEGRFLVRQYGCANCHLAGAAPAFDAPAFDAPAFDAPAFDAPGFDRIGSRLHSNWMAEWILNPGADRPARMPQLFRGPEARAQAEAVAAYLSALTGEVALTNDKTNDRERAAGETLFRDLRCASCHTVPGEPAMADRMSLGHVAQKFAALPEFLENPQAHYRVNPMPDFKLTATEARELAAFLRQRAGQKESQAAAKVATTAANIAKGKALVQASGCLNCHGSDLQNEFKAPPFSAITQSRLGCLDPNSTRPPRFPFASGEKEKIVAFLAMQQPLAPGRNVPHEQALRETKMLQCAQCHRESGLPEPLTLGGKLKPEWAAHFIAGKVPYKPRPWLKTRMPAFPAYATPLAAGLAALHGHPARTPSEGVSHPEGVSVGAKLVSSAGGFSCVACHPVKDAASAVVVESPGVNLAYSGERLLGSFFHRWLMNPIAIDPGTKMPVYFDTEGRSQLTEFFEGDAAKQIDAIWEYLRLGDKMPPPPTP
jgi:mono/diheme cytochrome c family protein